MENSIKDFIQDKRDDVLWMKRLSFASILVSSNLLQTMFTNTLYEEQLTSKQWLLLTIISSLPQPPTLSEAGEAMGCSRQNVKQIADILQKKHYLEFCKLDGDKNTIRLRPTEKWEKCCKGSNDETSGILESIFEGFEPDQVRDFFEMYCKMMVNIEQINKNLIDKKSNKNDYI